MSNTIKKFGTCTLERLRVIRDPRGCLSVIEEYIDVDFNIKRIYYIYAVDKGAQRAAHAHRKLDQLFIAIAGSFCIEFEDQTGKYSVDLSEPGVGLRVPKLVWRNLKNFSPDGVCLVLASERYKESDYIRNYSDFLNLIK